MQIFLRNINFSEKIPDFVRLKNAAQYDSLAVVSLYCQFNYENFGLCRDV